MNAQQWLLVSPGWKQEPILKTHTHKHTHTARYHDNRSIWTQQIAGFGLQSQIPSRVHQERKRGAGDNKTHTPPNTHTHTHTACPSPGAGKKVGLVSLSLRVWERDEHEAIHWCHPELSLLYLQRERQNRKKKEKKKENPPQFIIHGRGDFPFRAPLTKLSRHVSLSISPDKCQSKGSSPACFPFGKRRRICETMATRLHWQCVVLRGGNDPRFSTRLISASHHLCPSGG